MKGQNSDSTYNPSNSVDYGSANGTGTNKNDTDTQTGQKNTTHSKKNSKNG